MGFEVSFTQKPMYLHAVITGENSAENVRNYLKQIQRECKTRKCLRVMIEERLEGPRLGIIDVYRIVSEGTVRALGQIQMIAYVDVNSKGDLMKFAEDVAVNRFLRVAVFSSVPDAELWLQNLPTNRGKN
jgi:serine kinase of HPr protein (carbohydrate metabolism regulator)